jgi:hypothetical protein
VTRPADIDAARYARVKEVFFAVHTLPREGWPAVLERECAGDAALREEVESLLEHHKPESLIESPMERAAARIAQVTFDRGATGKWHEEQRQYLGQRVRILALLLHLLVGIASLRAFGFFGIATKLPYLTSVGMLGGWALLGVLSGLLLVLRTASYKTLRWLELALMSVSAVALFSWSCGWLVSGVALREPPSRELESLLREYLWVMSSGRTTHFRVGNSFLSVLTANQWSLLAAAYGLLIPNTLRRGVAVLGLLLLGTLSVIIAAASRNPALRPIAVELCVSSLFLVGLVGALGIYVGQRFQALRRAVFDAQQVGQYKLIRPLGKGAMGEVYLAQHRLLHRPCAVKLIRPEQAGSEDWLLRFEREVQAMAQLTHPNTVEVYDFGRTEDDSFFYAMEYLPGKTLDALLRVHGPLPAGRVIYFLRQLCGALAEAHDKGLVHRDIKPGKVTSVEKSGFLVRTPTLHPRTNCARDIVLTSVRPAIGIMAGATAKD